LSVTINAPDFATLVDAAAALPDGGTLYLPSDKGPYKVPDGAALDFSRLGHFTVRGDGFRAGSTDGSAVVGKVAGDLIKRDGPGTGHSFLFDGLTVRNTDPAGTAVHVDNFVCGEFHRVQFMGFKGLVADANSFNLYLHGCKVNGGTSAPGSVGLTLTSHTQVTACDVTGWDEGVRACGTTVNVTGCRLEVNRTALRLGVDPTGRTWLLTRSAVQGCSFEANDIAIDLNNVAFATLGGIGIQGSPNSPSRQSRYGVIDRTSKFYEAAAVLVGGQFSGAAVRFEPNPSRVAHWRLCQATNGLAGGKGWDVPAGVGRVTRTDCV
jgi:hypothetical protein